MDRDTIIRLAREAHGAMLASGRGMYLWHGEAYAGDVQDFCNRFAALVAAHEREACAKVCEELELKSADGQLGTYIAGWSDGTDDCAAAIRSRKC